MPNEDPRVADDLLDQIRRYIGRVGTDHDPLTVLVDQLDEELTCGRPLPREWERLR